MENINSGSDQTDPDSSNADHDAVTSPDVNLDQAAVREYFASDDYANRPSRLPAEDRPYRVRRGVAVWAQPGIPSLIAGPLGLACIVLGFGIVLPIGIELLEDIWVGRPTYWVMMFFVQSLFLPPMIGFGFAAVTPMFWYGSVALRFAIALLATLPGCLGFYVTLLILDQGGPDDFLLAFSLVMFSSLLGSAAVAVTVQFWSRWTMSHRRFESGPLPVPGIRSMIELTALAAIGYTILITLDTTEYLVGILFFGAFGIFSATAVISSLIVYFRTVEGIQSRTTAVIAGFVFTFATAFLVNGFFASMEYGWDILSTEVLFISLLSLYGGVVNLGVIWLCLRWLRMAGWTCIDRRSKPERTAGN